MQFKPGDKVRRLSAYQHRGGWAHGGEAVEVKMVRGNLLAMEGNDVPRWFAERFELDTSPNAAQLAATAKFDGKPEPTPAETVKLKGDLKKVLDCFRFHRDPMTLQFIACRTGVSELSVGSRVRDLRKPKFGGYTIERTKTSLKHEYQLKGVA